MDDKKASEILMGLLKKDVLNKQEKEAIESAIGILSWVAPASNRIKKIKKKDNV